MEYFSVMQNLSHQHQQLIILLITAIVITKIPIIGSFIAVLNTLLHEDGHALTALLLRGKVVSIKLYPNTEGLTVTQQKGWLANTIIAYAGYTFASLAAFFSFFLLHLGKVDLLLSSFLFLALANIVLWVRNMYGLIWLFIFIFGCSWVLLHGSNWIRETVAIFLSSVLLTQSILSSYHIFVLSFKKRKEAGDATNLASFTKLPAFFWGSMFLVQSCFIGYYAVRFIIT